MSKDVIRFCGEIIEAHPSAMFKVRLENGAIIVGHLSGRIRQNKIKIVVGDQVDVEMSPYDLTKGRIIHRRALRDALEI